MTYLTRGVRVGLAAGAALCSKQGTLVGARAFHLIVDPGIMGIDHRVLPMASHP